MAFPTWKTMEDSMGKSRNSLKRSDNNHSVLNSFYDSEQLAESIQSNDHQISSPRLSMASRATAPSPESQWGLSRLPTPLISPSLKFHNIASIQRREGTIYSIAVSNRLIFTGTDSSRIRAWNMEDCLVRGHAKASSGQVRAILTYGSLLFTSHKDYKIRMWKLTSSGYLRIKKIQTLNPKKGLFNLFPSRARARAHNSLPGHSDVISCMAYHPGERLLYTGSWDKTVGVWAVLDRTCVDRFLAHEDKVNAIVISQEDGNIFSGSSDGSIKIWRRVYGEFSHFLTMTLRFQPSPVNSLALSSTGSYSNLLYSGSSDGTISFWVKEKFSGGFIHGGVLQSHRYAVLCLEALGNLIFSGSEDATIRVWKREKETCFHECLAVIDGHRGPVKCLSICYHIMEDGLKWYMVCSAGLDRTLKVWKLKLLQDDDHCSNCDGSDMQIADYGVSPVLSPSWVKKKLQDNLY